MTEQRKYAAARPEPHVKTGSETSDPLNTFVIMFFHRAHHRYF
jgi:hypothetical protein